jgi:hypothetical protein
MNTTLFAAIGIGFCCACFGAFVISLFETEDDADE